MTSEAAHPTSAMPFHYYDWHLTDEDLMGESAIQDYLLAYLVAVLRHLLDDQPMFVARNLNIYTERVARQIPIAPDIAVFRGVTIDTTDTTAAGTALTRLRSWRTYERDRPPPALVIEIAAESTWSVDLNEKPARYASLGVDEYLLYDPNEPAIVPGGRLRQWRRAGTDLLPVLPDARSRYWSTVSDSYLVSDGAWLRLTNRADVRRSTAEETERAAAARERMAKESARAIAARERAAKEVERAAKEVAWAKLRELGIDPATLE